MRDCSLGRGRRLPDRRSRRRSRSRCAWAWSPTTAPSSRPAAQASTTTPVGDARRGGGRGGGCGDRRGGGADDHDRCFGRLRSAALGAGQSPPSESKTDTRSLAYTLTDSELQLHRPRELSGSLRDYLGAGADRRRRPVRATTELDKCVEQVSAKVEANAFAVDQGHVQRPGGQHHGRPGRTRRPRRAAGPTSSTRSARTCASPLSAAGSTVVPRKSPLRRALSSLPDFAGRESPAPRIC